MRSQRLIFIKIFCSYLIILLISLVFFVAVNSVTISIIRNNSYDTFNNSLSQTINFVDSRFEEVEAIFEYIKSDSSIKSVMDNSAYADEDFSYYDIYTASQNLFSYNEVNKAIDSVNVFVYNGNYVFSNKSGTVIDDAHITNINGILLDEQNIAKIYGSMHINTYTRLATVDGEEMFVISSIVSPTDATVLGALVVAISNDFLADGLQEFQPNQMGISYILDEDMELVYSLRGEECTLTSDNTSYSNWLITQEIPSGYTFYTQQSANNGWHYCTIVSDQTIYGQALFMQNILIVVACGLLLLGLFVSIIFSNNNSSVFRKILPYLRKFGTEEQSKDTYEYIERSVSNLVETHSNLVTNLATKKPLLEAAALQKLLMQSPIDYDTTTILKDIDIEKNANTIVVIAQNRVLYNILDESQQGDTVLFARVKEEITQKYTNTAYALDIDRETCAMLLVVDGQSTDEISALLRTVAREISTQGNQQILFFVSDIVSGIENIHIAFSQALKISKNAMLATDKFIYVSSSLNVEDNYEYSAETEIKLSLYAKNGELDKVKQTLTDIYIVNFVENPHSNEVLSQLVGALRATLVKNKSTFLINDSLKSDYEALDYATSVNDIFNAVVRVYTSICQNSSEFKSVKESETIFAILEFMNNNLSDSAFTIRDVCNDFSLSESSANKLFKDSLQKTFTEVLESIRIEKACELLRLETMSIKNISDACGYTSDGSFRRAFKRCVGVSPSQYSKAIK